MQSRIRALHLVSLPTALLATACSSTPTPVRDAANDLVDAAYADIPSLLDTGCAPPANSVCATGTAVPGASVPDGFCLRRFSADPQEARTLSFAPNGDLFVGAPSVATAGGASGGPGSIVVLSDDNHDGTAEVHTFAGGLDDVHGLAVTASSVYFTTANALWRTPYTVGQRAETPGARVMLAALQSDPRWTHGLAVDRDGWVLVSTGVLDEGCGETGVGRIEALGTAGLQSVATGMRNPMYLRCHATDAICVASELGRDVESTAHERIFVVRSGMDFRYPSCYGVGVPSAGCPASACASIPSEDVTIPIDDTPFGLDWEPGGWPAPYANALFVAKHGDFFSSPQWQNAGLYWIAADPVTHVPSGVPQPFAFGFGVGAPMMRRPADVAFSSDGRLFFSDDHGGGVYWVAHVACAR